MIRKLLLIIPLAVLVFGAYIFYGQPKCPDDFSTSEESVKAMNNWTNEYFDNHPNATLEDWSNARLDYYQQNNCTEAIDRWNRVKSGEVSAEEMKYIDQAIDSFR